MPEELPDKNLVRLTLTGTPQEAFLIANMLKEVGIKARVVGDYLAGGLGEVPGTNPEVWVAEEDVARATAMLEQVQDNRDEEE